MLRAVGFRFLRFWDVLCAVSWALQEAISVGYGLRPKHSEQSIQTRVDDAGQYFIARH